MRKYIYIYALLLQSIIVYSQDSTQNSVLWKIKSKGEKTESFLYGTIHGICKEDIKLPEKVFNALKLSNKLVFECNYSSFDPYKEKNIIISVPIPIGDFLVGVPIFSIPRDISSNDFLPDNAVLKDIMEDDKYEFVNQFFKDSLHVKKGIKPYQRLNPVFPLSTIERSMLQCPISSYEEYIGHKMFNSIFRYKGLETKDEHAVFFSKTKTNHEWAELMYTTAKDYTKLKTEFKSGYLELIKQYNLENLSYFVSDPEDKEDKILIIDRNINWIPKIVKLIKEPNTVIAVGIGHLAGEYGLINLLKKEGYIVEPVF